MRVRFADDIERLRELSVGQRIRVSGLWRASGQLEVTRIERAGVSEPDAVLAPTSAVAANRVTALALVLRGLAALL